MVGLSARALAAAARSAGYRPLAADLFNDLDLQEIAEASVRIGGDLERGVEWGPLINALEELAADRDPIGIVYGAGFEDRADLLDRLAERWEVLGNSAAAVARAKDPVVLAEICGRLALPHPRSSSKPEAADWLGKQRGGAGGSHIRGRGVEDSFSHPTRVFPSRASREPKSETSDFGREKVPATRLRRSEAAPASPRRERADEGVPAVESSREPLTAWRCPSPSPSPPKSGAPELGIEKAKPDASDFAWGGGYWQERVPGDPVSALILGSGSEAVVLGFSEQWSDPAVDAPFRYGGAVRPASLPSGTAAALTSAARRVGEALGLVGLNSVDFLVDGDAWHLIEVNPRPGATLDVFDPEAELFRLHVDACRAGIPAALPHFTGAAAAAIVYAREPIERVPDIAWPEWAADRQAPDTRVAAGAPLCTVLARADEAGEARRLVRGRAEAIRALLAPGCALA